MSDVPQLNRPLVTLAALLGAVGVGTAARASHAALPDLAIAANFLLLHAPALLFMATRPRSWAVLAAATLLVVGLVLFAGDLAMRDLGGHALFPMAAPAGGIGLMLGWVALGLSPWISPRRS